MQGGAVSFSLSGADAAAFTIDSTTGAVTFNASPDFEAKSSYSFNVKASDPSGAFNTQAVTVSVTSDKDREISRSRDSKQVGLWTLPWQLFGQRTR